VTDIQEIADFEYGPFKAKVAELQGVIEICRVALEEYRAREVVLERRAERCRAALEENRAREVVLERRAERWKEAARAYRSMSPYLLKVFTNRGSLPTWENLRSVMGRPKR
jgi:hypothetical protein